MADVSTLVLESGARTTTQPALIAWSERREAARLEREQYRTRLIQKAEASQRAAIASQTRPVKTKTEHGSRKVRADGTHPNSRTQPLKLVLCAGTCGRMTRGKHLPETAAPGTTRRYQDGKCKPCYTGQPTAPRPASTERLRPCAGGCGKTTRPAKMGAAEAPNTVPRKLHGKCSTCLTGGLSKVPPKVDLTELADQYAAGKSIDTLAADFGISPTTTRDYLLRAGVTLRGRGDTQRGVLKTYPPEVVDAVRKAYHDDQQNLDQTAATVGLGVETVLRIMRRNDIPSRNTAGLRSRALS